MEFVTSSLKNSVLYQGAGQTGLLITLLMPLDCHKTGNLLNKI